MLTDDGALAHCLTDPGHKTWKTYWVQVEKVPTEADLDGLRHGVRLKEGTTLPARARLLETAPKLWPRDPPVRFRASIPTQWLEIQIHKGRNRQIRRMTAAIGFPTLRLVRCAVGDWSLGDLAPGQWRSIEAPTRPARRRSRPVSGSHRRPGRAR